MIFPNIKVGDFEGPFDLLLHLIKQSKMDIHDIKIYEITNQYLEYLNKMKELDLEVTSEFIVIAATLLEIKSKTLLPKAIDEKQEEEGDPRKNLVEKLIIYRKIKQAAELLKTKSLYTGAVFTKKPEIIEDVPKDKNNNNDDILKNITMLDLYNLYNKLIELYRSKQNTENIIEKRISIDRYKIEDKMEFIKEKISTKEYIEFSSLLFDCECKLEAVVTFLAVLELIKQMSIKVTQKESFSDIIIERMIESE
ncbi:segregation and condensation protein A [Clostridium polyendosporum]|uniref:Segregation and condensation protein A n=1 Tax=Clostridium polyendosporum TaxID=69208 RepID=A0A919S4P7_9CLOT|nr:segregation/condensation protein A [Clostridium polyendosporum]GIM30548.1 segregation and condensation protein A [Clostridium polyendosporum]